MIGELYGSRSTMSCDWITFVTLIDVPHRHSQIVLYDVDSRLVSRYIAHLSNKYRVKQSDKNKKKKKKKGNKRYWLYAESWQQAQTNCSCRVSTIVLSRLPTTKSNFQLFFQRTTNRNQRIEKKIPRSRHWDIRQDSHLDRQVDPATDSPINWRFFIFKNTTTYKKITLLERDCLTTETIGRIRTNKKRKQFERLFFF